MGGTFKGGNKYAEAEEDNYMPTSSKKPTQKNVPNTRAPNKAQYEEYNDDDEDNNYVPSTQKQQPTKAKFQQEEAPRMSKPTTQPKTQNFKSSNNMVS